MQFKFIDIGSFGFQEQPVNACSPAASLETPAASSAKDERSSQMTLSFPNGMCLKIYQTMIGLSANLQYYLCCKPVDMRNGFDGLAGIVRNVLNQDPVSGSVFIFINRFGTHIKMLFWDGDGLALFTNVWSEAGILQETRINQHHRDSLPERNLSHNQDAAQLVAKISALEADQKSRD